MTNKIRLNNILDTFLLRYTNLIIIGFLILIFVSVSSTMYFKNITPDEFGETGAGITILKNNDWGFRTGRMAPPLSFYLSAIPLAFFDLPNSIWDLKYEYFRGNYILNSEKGEQILFWIRFPFILLSLLLAFYVFKWAKELYGLKAGFLALLLYSFNPIMLAFSNIANQDLIATTFMFIAIYYFWRFVSNPTKLGLIISAITFGLAQLSKFTSLILIPIFIILSLIVIYKNKNVKSPLNFPFINNFSDRKKSFFILSFSLLIIFFISFLMLWASYGFEVKTLSESIPKLQEQQVYNRLNEVLPENNFIKNLSFSIIKNIPIPLSSYIYNLRVQYEFISHGFSSFFMGKYFIEGLSYFYIVAFIIKSPIPLLILILLSIILFKKVKSKDLIGEYFLIIFIASYFIYWSFISNLSAVMRHILPTFPFIFVFVSKVANINFKKFRWRYYFRIFIGLLIIWYILSSVLIYPSYIAYFNEFVGGPNNGYKYMVDSHLDWGQDLKGLKKYMDKNNINNIKLSYFGAGSVGYYNISYTYLPSPTNLSSYSKPPEGYPMNLSFFKPPKGYVEKCGYTEGLLAVSATNLQGLYLENRSCYNWLKEYEANYKIGYSIFIYNIPSNQTY